MKSFLKRSAIGLAVLGITCSANASMFNSHGYFIGVEGLSLRPMNGDLDWFYVNTSSGGERIGAISTDHDWGWRLFGGLKFGDNEDLTLSWTRLRSSSSDSEDFDAIGNNIRFVDTSATEARAKVNFDLDEVYGVMGHTINFNNLWSLRVAGGLTFARIDSDMKVSLDSSNASDVSSATAKSRLRGWGPRAEADVGYRLNPNFALFANGNTSLLVADRNTSVDFFSSGDFTHEYDFSGRNVVVPKLGMRLGVSYSCMMGQAGSEGAGTSVTIAAGWQVESYIHAIERYQTFNDLPDTTVSNFGDQGVFLGIAFNSGWM